VQRITGECGTRPVTLSEISLLLAKIISAWYEGKNKNTEGNGASDKSFDRCGKNSCVYDCLWASLGRHTAENVNAECFVFEYTIVQCGGRPGRTWKDIYLFNYWLNYLLTYLLTYIRQ
jgi:hypothetical protein